MTIPKKFKIGGQWFEVKFQDLIDNGDNFGEFSYCPPYIKLATKYKDEHNNLVDIPENQLENTFKHELMHCWQYMKGSETDETEASTFAAFWCEFDETKEY